MKDPVKRLRQTIAIAIIFLVAYTAVMLGVEQHYNRALQSMAERKLLQYAQSNITINLGDAAVNKADTSKTS